MKNEDMPIKNISLVPVWIDPVIVDMATLMRRFGNLTKRFGSWVEMELWLKKAKKLRPEMDV